MLLNDLRDNLKAIFMGSSAEIPPVIDESKERYEQGFKRAKELKDEIYDDAVKEHSEKEGVRENLEVHEEVVRQYGEELIKAHPHLTEEQKTAARFALEFHDSAKLTQGLLEHHRGGADNAEKVLQQIKEEGYTLNGIEITDNLILKVKQAIDRHMNHPFLVGLRGGERFPEPQDDVDKIVFDADMMANIGAKNVAFRLVNEKFMANDATKAEEKNVCHIEESFNNVMTDVRKLDEVVLSEPAKEKTKILIQNMERIFDKLTEKKEDGKNVLEKIQADFSDTEGNFNILVMREKFGEDYLSKIKNQLNEAVEKAGKSLNIDDKILRNFKI